MNISFEYKSNLIIGFPTFAKNDRRLQQMMIERDEK